ncbi:efflux RND transporter permease subunit [bacterium]|nr:efflux RND transporter permease subunit [bacterium]
MNAILKFFTTRHYLSNFIFLGVLLCGLLAWKKIRKEELPEFESTRFRIVAPLRGATARDVEELVTIPIEEELRGISGVASVDSTSSVGGASISVELDSSLSKFTETIQEIKDAAEKAKLPSETREDLSFRHFKTTEKAILDVALYLPEGPEEAFVSRLKLQEYVLALESRLLSLSEVSAIDRRGYLQRELKVLINPLKLKQYYMPLQRIISTLQNAHIVSPSGPLEDKNETQVTLIARNENKEDLENLVVRANDNASVIRLSDLATVEDGFERQDSILKVNGREAVILNVKKSASTDIIRAQEMISKEIDVFKSSMGQDSVQILLMDDESYDVRNRLELIISNGLLGFVLILLILFLFLDFKSGVWTAMGMPFCLAATLVTAWILGYTVNNVTLAAIIIVLGIVVDDAIIISEHISRLRQSGMKTLDAAVVGTREMVLPVLASILTTCVAFLPFFFFSGRLANFVKFMPALIFAMLVASFFESIFILPSHLVLGKDTKVASNKFRKIEEVYRNFLSKIIAQKYWVVGVFSLVLGLVVIVGGAQLRFVLFPREEVKELFLELEAEASITKNEMAALVESIEAVFLEEESSSEIVGFRTMVAQNRWGSEAQDNRAFLQIELRDKGDRSMSTGELSRLWEKRLEPFEGFKKKGFIHGRFGSTTGSPIEIEVRENNDQRREQLSIAIAEYLGQQENLADVEIDKPLQKSGIDLILKQKESVLSSVEPSQLSAVARVFMEGSIMYSFLKDDEEVDVRLSLASGAKSSPTMIADLLVENKYENLMPFSRLLDFKSTSRPANIVRTDNKRKNLVLANIKEGSEITPLEIAEKTENELFPRLHKKFPSSILKFVGEVEESRTSGSDLKLASLLVLVLVYGILLLLYNSVTLPLMVMTAIPFGLCGVIIALFLHSQFQYGFFTVVGTLGMIGVVVNDSIVMLSRLETARGGSRWISYEKAAECASTRLRAVLLTTLTTVAGLLPTAYGVFGFDSMLSEMMLAMAWGLVFGTAITLIFIPSLYLCFYGRK